MRTVRNNVFETNSSSTHTVTIIPKEDYDKLKSDENLWWHEEEGVKTEEEAIKLLSDTTKNYYFDEDYEELDEDERHEINAGALRDDGWYSIGWEDDEHESEMTEYTSKSGDKIVIICTIGYN